MKKAKLLFIMVMASFPSFAQQMTLEAAVKKQINFDNGGQYYSFDLKTVPNNGALSVAAVTKNNGGQPNDEGFVVDLILLLVDNASQKILSKYTEEEKFVSDAVSLQPVTLDMANYTIADGIRAFGVRDNYRGNSRPNPYAAGNISLYYIKNKKIELLLDKLETYSYTGETDMKCLFEGEETHTVLIMQKTKTNGFFDIKIESVTTVIISDNPLKEGDDCISTEKKLKPKKQLLQYVNGKYELQKKK